MACKCTYCGTEYNDSAGAEACATSDAIADMNAGVDTRHLKED